MIGRRTVLLGALAAGLAACSSGSGESDASGAPIGTVGLGNGTGDGGTLAVESPSNPDRSKVPSSIAMVGDSITVLSTEALKSVLATVGFSSVTINAEVSRRIEVGTKPTPGLDIITYIAATTPPPKMWVVALGTNDAGLYANDDDYQGLIDDVLDVIPEDAPLVWVSTYREDHVEACERFNLLLRATLRDRGNATVGEWYQQVVKSKGDILTKDGVHPNADGILVFADTVRSAIATELK